MPSPDQDMIARRNKIAEDLTKILGSDGIVAQQDAMSVFESDGLNGYRATPLVVALPANTEEVSQVLKYCHFLDDEFSIIQNFLLRKIKSKLSSKNAIKDCTRYFIKDKNIISIFGDDIVAKCISYLDSSYYGPIFILSILNHTLANT